MPLAENMAKVRDSKGTVHFFAKKDLAAGATAGGVSGGGDSVFVNSGGFINLVADEHDVQYFTVLMQPPDLLAGFSLNGERQSGAAPDPDGGRSFITDSVGIIEDGVGAHASIAVNYNVAHIADGYGHFASVDWFLGGADNLTTGGLDFRMADDGGFYFSPQPAGVEVANLDDEGPFQVALYVIQNEGGKYELRARFQTGDPVVICTQP